MDVLARLRSLLEHAAIDDPGRAGDVAGATDEARNATAAATSHSHDWPPASLEPRRDRPAIARAGAQRIIELENEIAALRRQLVRRQKS